MPCDFEEVDVPSFDTYGINVDNVLDVGRIEVLEPDSNRATQTLSSEIIPRDWVAHFYSLQSRQLLAVLDGPDVCINRAELCNIVQRTVELLPDNSAAQSKPPLCDKQADDQSTVA